MPEIDDSFWVGTDDGCAAVHFVDDGPGAPGGGDNDDYLVIHDYCWDGYGTYVTAWVVRDGTHALGGMYNGNGTDGDPVVWDPYQTIGDVLPGDLIGIEVCVVDGPNHTPVDGNCDTGDNVSVDG